MYPPAVRLFVVFAIVSLAGFFFAGWTAGGTVPVLVGVVGMFAAGASFIAALDDRTLIDKRAT